MSAKIEKKQLIPGKPIIKCPTCGGLADPKARPFCSSHCADVDLGYWFQGKYALPAVEAADDTIFEAVAESLVDLMEEDDNS